MCFWRVSHRGSSGAGNVVTIRQFLHAYIRFELTQSVYKKCSMSLILKHQSSSETTFLYFSVTFVLIQISCVLYTNL